MLGALGKTNLTSSNLLRLRQFSARKILSFVRYYELESCQPNYHPAPLSPSPWATMTVAVWRLIAGTTRGALPDILKNRQG